MSMFVVLLFLNILLMNDLACRQASILLSAPIVPSPGLLFYCLADLFHHHIENAPQTGGIFFASFLPDLSEKRI